MVLNRVQAHGVQQTIGKIANGVHDYNGPKHGVGQSVQFAARGDDLD